MKSGFPDPIDIKVQSPKDASKNEKNSCWSFKCPNYDDRSSSFINAGTHYGIGHRQPVGHKGNPKEKAETLPFGHKKGMKDDEKG